MSQSTLPTTATEFHEWIEHQDLVSRPFRAARMRRVVEGYGDPELGRLFPGGPVSAFAFTEARLAFVNGLFMSTILVSQICVEHTLHGMFAWMGRDDLDRVSFKTLLTEAEAERLITDEEHELWERLRVTRNPYAHPRSLRDGDLLSRSADLDVAIEDLLVDDAEASIDALLALTRRYPFALRDDRPARDN